MQKVTEILLDSGIRAHVSPLSRYQRNALIEEAEALYPYPDKKQYEVPLSEDIAIPGSVTEAEEHPEYQALVRAANAQRQEYISEAILNLCVTFPDFVSEQALIEHFAPYLEKQQRWLTLPEDAWQATLRFAVIRSPGDENEILSIAKDELPVTEKEVNENVRIFQPVLSRQKSRLVDAARWLAPGAENKVSGEKQ